MNGYPSHTLEQKISSCLEIMNNGGGIFNVKLRSSDLDLSLLFDDEWVINHFSSLNMITLQIPSHGSFCLLHPDILFWEEDKDNIIQLNEEE
tara:strand:+ start:199 stop:474 length:276 start_codon:yes stop_codon:yes gene_type:complete